MATAINLLPDVKQKKNTAKRRRQSVSAITFIAIIACVGVIVMVLIFKAGQRLRINQLQHQIDDKKQQVQSQTELPKALTVQAHLAALPGLYEKRVLMTKLFEALQNFSLRDISVGTADVDSSNVLKIAGTARTYTTVTKFARALEAANVTIGSGANATNQPYFSDIQISHATNSDNKVDFDLTTKVSQGVTGAKP